ncbi:MAG: uroporphyrinogen decarboxylase family protein [Anaerolineae bacterium]
MVPTMTVRQRLLAALQHGETDRMPIALYGVYPHSPNDWRQSRPSYRPLLEFAREHTDPFCQWACERGVFYTDVPMRVQSLEGNAFAEWTVKTPAGPLICITNTSLATQWVKKFYLTDDDDVQRFLSIPYRPVCPDLGPAVALEGAVGEQALMTTTFLDALGVVADLFTPDDFAIRCLLEKGTVKRLIEKVHEHLHDYLHYLLDHGPRSLYIIGGPELATAPLLSPAYFDEFVIPYDSQLIDMIHQHGSWVAIHCHGRLNGVLERIADMGPDGLHPMEAPPMGNVPLAEVKRRVGNRICLIGNVQIGDVVGGLPEDVDHLVEEAVTCGTPGGGFILSTTASPYEEELSSHSLRNYMQLVESGRRHASRIGR